MDQMGSPYLLAHGLGVPVTVQSAEGEKTMTLDQTKPASGPDGFQSLGRFRFASQHPSAVLFQVAGARGTVHVDAIQVLPAR